VCIITVLDYGQWAVLEPVMTVEVGAPADFQGSVLAGLTKRQAVIIGQDATEGFFSIVCEVCYTAEVCLDCLFHLVHSLMILT